LAYLPFTRAPQREQNTSSGRSELPHCVQYAGAPSLVSDVSVTAAAAVGRGRERGAREVRTLRRPLARLYLSG